MPCPFSTVPGRFLLLVSLPPRGATAQRGHLLSWCRLPPLNTHRRLSPARGLLSLPAGFSLTAGPCGQSPAPLRDPRPSGGLRRGGGEQLRPSGLLRAPTDPPHRNPPRARTCPQLSQPWLCSLVNRPGLWEGLGGAFRRSAAFPEPSWPLSPHPRPSPQIITSEEAERRGQIYDRQGATYLFDLDYVEDVYTVDAAYYGNISHFVNHSVGTPQVGGGREEQAGAPPHPPAVLFRLV